MPRIDTVVSCPVRPSFRVVQVQGMFDVCRSGTRHRTLRRRTARRRRAMADRADRRPVRQRQDDDRPSGVRPAGGNAPLAARSRRRRLLRPPLDQGNHRHAHRGRLQFAAGMGQAVSLPFARRALPLRPGGDNRRPPAWCSTSSPAWSIARSRHWLGGGGQGGAADVVRASACERKQFVAVTCHYDVAVWLEPDWVLDMVGQISNLPTPRQIGNLPQKAQWVRLRRPQLRLQLHRTTAGVWPLFRVITI